MSLARLAAALALFVVAHSAVHAQPTIVIPMPIPVEQPTDSDTDVVRITIFGKIEDDLAHSVASKILVACRTTTTNPIVLYIDSPGGNVVEGGLIVSAMLLCTNRPIYTVDIASADSMAAVIFEYGSKRFMFPKAELMFHEARGGGIGTPEQLLSEAVHIKKMIDGYEAYLCKRLGISLESLKQKEHSELWLSATEAIEARASDVTGNPVP